MFTQVKSTIRHIAPDRLGERKLVKVVYVVLESQYQSALSAAVNDLNEHNPNLAVNLSGYLIEELRDPENYAAFQEDVANANIFIASLIFIEDLAQKVVAAVEPHRPVHAEAEGKVGFVVPGLDAEGGANPTENPQVHARGPGPGCPQLHAFLPILVGGFGGEPGKLPADAGE